MKILKKRKIGFSAFILSMVMVMPVFASGEDISGRGYTYVYRPYNSTYHVIYKNGIFDGYENHTWEYSGLMVYCSKCGIYQ